MDALESRARKTYPKLLKTQRDLDFPAFECIPQCRPDPDNKGRYLYNPSDWGFARDGALRRYANEAATV